MYVIAVRNGGATRDIGGFNVGAGDTVIFPADRCAWDIRASTGGGYQINEVNFYAGNAASERVAGGSTSNTARFGFIGKSGRFVEIAS